MTRRNAITAVTGQVFEDDWTRQGRGRSQDKVRVNVNRSRNMARAAQGSRSAFFKMVRGGGTKTAAQLAGQFGYLFGREEKCVDVHDSRGTYDGHTVLTAEQITAAADRWAETWKGHTRAGHTTHMVMSFPHGTKVEHVSQIAREICEEKLGGRFDYMIAVHADRKHPHAHIIVNRRNEQGEFFYLKRGTEHSYETFRQAMVDHASRHGVQLEATGRLERGIPTRGPTTGEWQAEKKKAAATGEAFMPPAGRARIGEDLARALARIEQFSGVYRGLAVAATRENFSDLASACERAAELLEDGQPIEAHGEPYMHTEEEFDRTYLEMRDKMVLMEARIEAAAPNERPRFEARRDEIYASISHMQPKGVRSAELNEPASESGVYSAVNRVAAVTQLTMQGRDKLDRALDGTGIDPVEVESRMRVGARSLSTERDWIAADLRAVAEARGFDLRQEQGMNKALDVLDETYDRVARDYGIDDAISRRDVAAAQGPTLEDLSRRDETSEREATARASREDAASLDEAVMARKAAWNDADAAALADRDRRAEQAADALRPTVASAGMSNEARADLRAHAYPVGAEDERRLKEAVERNLSHDDLDKLRRGDATGLVGVGTRADQLEMARDYLRATKDANQTAVDRVNEQLAAERAQTRRGHDQGVDHG